MSTTLLIRNLPTHLKRHIASESRKRMVSQAEVAIALIERGRDASDVPLPFDEPPAAPQPVVLGIPFRFVDLFAGIGGFRIGLQRCGGQSVFSCEWDRNAQKTYQAWFGETPAGDIRSIDPAEIPDHHVLAAGFPCQPFSIAGVSKKKSLGHEHGFRDETQGILFFHLAKVIKTKRPPVIFLENVKNLKSHDKGKTWEVIRGTLEGLNYTIFDRIIDAAGWVPQHRERIFIVGFDRKVFGDKPTFCFPESPRGRRPQFRDVLESDTPAKYTLTDHLWKYLQNYAAKHKAKGNGFGFGLTELDGVSRTLSARYYKDGSEVLIPQGEARNPRRLSPSEARRLMGFPDDLPIVVSDTQAYRQFGNAVVPLVVEAIGREIVRAMGTRPVRFAENRLSKTTRRR